jgi:hypothetical protein
MEMDHLCCAGAPQELDVGPATGTGRSVADRTGDDGVFALEIEFHIPLLSGDLLML